MSQRARLATAVLAGLIVLVLGGSALQFRAKRNDAQAKTARLQAMLADSKHEVQTLRSALGQAGGLNAQVVWDKSHLLDCWVVIQRVAPPGLLNHDLATYPVPSEHTARSTQDLVGRCASDALP
jgi:hypothetical protein